MAVLIEQLQGRVLFSATTPAALGVLRRDVSAISQPVAILQRTCTAETAQIAAELRIFHASNGPVLVAGLRTTFAADLKNLKADIVSAKLLYNRAINHVAADAKLLARRPGNVAVEDRLADDEGLLTAQAAAGGDTLFSDTNTLQRACAIDLAAITNAHPIDATLASETAAFTNTLSSESGVLSGITGNIASNDVPNYLASL